MELDWSWPEIGRILTHRLMPEGGLLSRKDLGSLPEDRVLIDYRDPEGTFIKFSFVTLKTAERLRPKVLGATGQKVGVSQLQGLWMKLSAVLLWKFAKDGLSITPRDREAVPDFKLLVEGHANDLELRWVSRSEGDRIARRELEQEGKRILLP
jgi:hypothetical protein